MIIIFPVNWPRSRYPGHASRNDKDRLFRGRCSRKCCSENLFGEVCKRFVGNIVIYSTPSLYNAVVLQSRALHKRARHVSAKNKNRKGKKKISKKAFTSRPMNSRNFSSRGLFVSIPSFKFSTFETSGKRVVFIHRNHHEEEINPSLIILNI